MWIHGRWIRRMHIHSAGCRQDKSDARSKSRRIPLKARFFAYVPLQSANPSPTDPASSGSALSIPSRMRRIVREEGVKTLFRGGMARTTWISLGGAIFLGAYETVMSIIRTDIEE
jgi:hypothetical protein